MRNGLPQLTIAAMIEEARIFGEYQSSISHPSILGKSDGKAVGTYIEHLFQNHLQSKYQVNMGNSARGIDIPDININTDIKVTSKRQPQSSSPYKSPRQKIFGLGHNLLIFVYDKQDLMGESRIIFENITFVPEDRTGDFTLTKNINELKASGIATVETIEELLKTIKLPVVGLTTEELAEEILVREVKQGYITISNALQWRLQYSRPTTLKNTVRGIVNYDIEL